MALSASASQPRVVVAGVAPLPSQATVVNKVITASFDVALASSHQSALNAYVASLSNTASPNYQHFLTPAQYAKRFGASAASLNAVRDYLKSYGINVGTLSKGHNILRASGTTTEIAKAVDASVETVRLSDGSLVPRLLSSATVPGSLAGDVLSFAGLSSVQPSTSNLEVAHADTAGPGVCPSNGGSATTTPNGLGGYTAQQQGQLYGLTTAWAAGDTGVGQTIAAYELGLYDASDLSTYLTCYGLSPTITPINIDGGPTGGYSEEATLDVEEAAALAPGATIEIYQGPNDNNGPTDTYSQIASDDTATIVTTSWGNCEAQTDGGAQAEQSIFEEMATQGQTVIAAAGDSGSADCAGAETNPVPTLSVDDPASQPYVTGVGGLTISNISPLSQTVWNDDCTQSDCGASGGGLSSFWSQPSWQKGSGITTSAATGGMRMVPDLSVMGDPSSGFIEYYTGTTSGFCRRACQTGWTSIGGTSIGAPLVSALVAVAAQSCDTPSGRLGFINPTLYSMSTADFVDVTTGNNDQWGIGDYSAGVGYDMASGLGSPNGDAFLTGLCPPAFSQSLSTFPASVAAATAAGTGSVINATLRDVNDNPITNATVDVTASASSGLLSIDNEQANTSGQGSATTEVTSDDNGLISFNVTSSVAQSVTVSVTYESQSIYTTSVIFKTAAAAKTTPGAPSIKKLVALVGGFALRLNPPTNTGGTAIKSYQYSINGGSKWILIPNGARAINVTNLLKGRTYSVIARAINATGKSPASVAHKVVTRS
jgi:kumamolisin